MAFRGNVEDNLHGMSELIKSVEIGSEASSVVPMLVVERVTLYVSLKSIRAVIIQYDSDIFVES